MTQSRTLFGFCLFAIGIMLFAWFDHRRSALDKDVLSLKTKWNNVLRLEIVFQNSAVMVKKKSAQDPWQIESFNGRPASDLRANQGMITHLLDLTGAINLHADQKVTYDASEAAQYGMTSPELTMKAGQATILFGNRGLNKNQVFVFFPNEKILMEAPSNTLSIIAQKSPLDIRDRRITTFDADDIEDLSSTGKCPNFLLSRDGDRWTGLKHATDPNLIDQWLGLLTNVHYVAIDESESATINIPGKPFCSVVFRGRKDRTETIHFYRAEEKIYAKNTVLPARYLLIPSSLDALEPPTD